MFLSSNSCVQIYTDSSFLTQTTQKSENLKSAFFRIKGTRSNALNLDCVEVPLHVNCWTFLMAVIDCMKPLWLRLRDWDLKQGIATCFVIGCVVAAFLIENGLVELWVENGWIETDRLLMVDTLILI